MKNLWFADIRDGGDFHVIAFQRQAIEVSTDLAQPHNAKTNFTAIHNCRSIRFDD
jgi:hypothetical protein